MVFNSKPDTRVISTISPPSSDEELKSIEFWPLKQHCREHVQKKRRIMHQKPPPRNSGNTIIRGTKANPIPTTQAHTTTTANHASSQINLSAGRHQHLHGAERQHGLTVNNVLAPFRRQRNTIAVLFKTLQRTLPIKVLRLSFEGSHEDSEIIVLGDSGFLAGSTWSLDPGKLHQPVLCVALLFLFLTTRLSP